MLGSVGMENTCFKFCAAQNGAAYALAAFSPNIIFVRIIHIICMQQ